MPKAIESPKPTTADEIAEFADRGENISRFFTKGKMMPPIVGAKKKSVAVYTKYDIVER